MERRDVESTTTTRERQGLGRLDNPSGPAFTGQRTEPRGSTGLSVLRSPKRFKRTFASLGIPAYRNLWLGSLLQMGSIQMQMMALGFFVYELTGSPSMLGVVMGASAVPALTLGLFGGVLADRFDKRRIIQASQVASGLTALFIAISITTNTITWQHLLVASLIQGSMMPLMLPARQAIVPKLVGTDRLMNAVALNSLVMSLTTMLAPAAAGLLIFFVGIGGAYYFMASLIVGAVFFTGLLPEVVEPARNGKERRSVFGDIADGFRYLRSNRAILALLFLSLSTMVFSFPIRFMLPIFASDIFHVGSRGLGFMLSAMGIGSLGGALFIASLGKLSHRGIILAGTGVASGSVLLAFALMSFLAPVYLAGLGLMVLVGLFQSGRMTLNNTLLMEYSDDEYRGRVMSIFSLNMSLMPAGVVPITIAAEFIGAPLALGVMAVLLIVIAAAYVLSNRQLRALQ